MFTKNSGDIYTSRGAHGTERVQLQVEHLILFLVRDIIEYRRLLFTSLFLLFFVLLVLLVRESTVLGA